MHTWILASLVSGDRLVCMAVSLENSRKTRRKKGRKVGRKDGRKQRKNEGREREGGRDY